MVENGENQYQISNNYVQWLKYLNKKEVIRPLFLIIKMVYI
jgi:hypothetical protein